MSRRDEPKFIIAGSVLAPLTVDSHGKGMWMRQDGFAGYPGDLDEIVAFILRNQIHGVVFVGGDLHLSCMSRLTLRDARACPKRHPDVAALQIVSSGLYAPLPFVNTSRYDVGFGQTSTIALRRSTVQYTPTLVSDCGAHFVKVDAQRDNGGWRITASAFDQDGKPVGEPASELLATHGPVTPAPCTLAPAPIAYA